MSPHRVVAILALALMLAAPSAWAFFDPPWITPAAPRAGEVVSVNIHGGICDVFLDRTGYPQISQEGNAIHVVEYGHREGFQDFCIFGLWTVAIPIGALQAGDYTITVDFLYNDYFLGPTTINVGVIPFTVTGVAAVAPVPAFTPLWGFVLLMLISATAFWALRTPRRSRC
jgi:hypothetical protein